MLKVASGLSAAGSLRYQGTWNAASNSPLLQSGVGTTGSYYVVNVAGSTNLDGITDWQVGDWAVFNGTAWQKIDNSDAVQSVNGQTGVVVLTAANVGAVANTVFVNAGAGLSGGGQLTSNVALALANTSVIAGSYGNASTVGTFTVDAQGRLTAAANSSIAISVAAVSGAVPNTVNVIAGTGLTGGGALTGNVTLTVAANTTQQLVAVQNNGTAISTRQIHNFIAGTNISITGADDSANGRANVTISTSGLGTMATQNANNVSITGGTISGVALTLGSLNNTPIGNTTPSTAVFTTMTTNGASFSIVTKTANYTLTTTDFAVLANATTAPFTVTLPTAIGASGQVYVIKKIDSTANAVTIATTLAQTIDNLSTYSLGYQYQGLMVQSNNANWSIVGVIPARNGTTGTF